MLVTFSKAITELYEILKDNPIVRSQKEITIVRDVYGINRLYFKPKEGEIPDSTGLDLLNKYLKEKLGSYWGGEIWLQKETPSMEALLEIIESEREPAQWDNPENLPRWFVLERYVSKYGWLNHQRKKIWSYQDIYDKHRPAIVAFYSFKGGMGRTTALASTALNLIQDGFNVGMVDVDLEAPGLSTLFFPYEIISSGTIDYLIEKPVQKDDWKLINSIKEVEIQYILAQDSTIIIEPGLIGEENKNPFGRLLLVPVGKVDDDYLVKLSRIDFQFQEGEPIRETVKQMLLELSESFTNLDFIFIDARAGFHDLSGLILGIPHIVILFGAESSQSWAGLEQVIHFLGQLQLSKEELEEIPIIMVHSMAPSEHTASLPWKEVSQRFLEKSYDVFSQKFYQEGEIPDQGDIQAYHYPITIPWKESFFGDIRFYHKAIEQEEIKAESEGIKVNIKSISEPSSGFRELSDRLRLLAGRGESKQ